MKTSRVLIVAVVVTLVTLIKEGREAALALH